jgi:HD-like signal output (HDOD) protein
MPTARELVDRVTDLVSLPDIYFRVQQLLEDSSASMGDIGRVIGADPALTARLLKIANNPFFGMPARIETISRALTVLGTRQLHDLLLASAVTAAFRALPEPHSDMESFWTRSVRCAVTARLIAFECHVLDSERLFVAGLLHDIGHLVMHQLMPADSAAAAAAAQQQQRPLADVECEMFGFHQAEVGALLLQKWRTPVVLQESILHQRDPQHAQRFCFESSIVHCAMHIAEALGAGESAVEALPRMSPFAVQQTGINESRLEAMEPRVNQHLADTLSVLLPGMRVASRG